MKKSIIIFLFTIANHAISQSKKLIKDVNVGAIVSTVASTTFEKGEKPFSVGHNISASMCFVTEKTAHNFMYGFGDNSITSLNAYFLKNNWDTYIVFSKSLNSDGKYLGWGIEKLEAIGNVKFFEFCELGTSFNGRPILSFGILMNVSWALKK